MQVFIVGSVAETAQALDLRRMRKQVIECRQIIDAINGTGKGWFNHPIVEMYREHKDWLRCYMWFLEEYLNDNCDFVMLSWFNKRCEDLRPSFHTKQFFDQMKRRLFTKDSEYYKQWAHLGADFDNWYWSPSENKFIKYRNGKRIE